MINDLTRRFLFARNLDLKSYQLEGLTTGEPVTLYHGTTKQFQHFDLNRSRDELVDQFYGKGIFLTPSHRVAVKYAEANRNIGFDPEIVDDLKRVNQPAGKFLENLVRLGNEAWDTIMEDFDLGEVPDFEARIGVNPNDLDRISGYVIGSKMDNSPGGDEPINIFQTHTGMPSYVYDTLDEVGIDSKKYRPKVYKVQVTVQKTLVTNRVAEARRARNKGYECVVFHGSNLVDGVPEVAVFSPQHVRIKSIEVL